MKRILLLIAVSCIGAVAAQAQEVMPVFVEGRSVQSQLKGSVHHREQIIAGDARDRGAAPIANGQSVNRNWRTRREHSGRVEGHERSHSTESSRTFDTGAMRERLHGQFLRRHGHWQ